jgi:hypothetical protein
MLVNSYILLDILPEDERMSEKTVADSTLILIFKKNSSCFKTVTPLDST